MDDRVRNVVISSSSCLVVMFCMTLVVILSPNAEAAITCEQVVGALKPCVSYIVGNADPAPSAACCAGVRGLNSSLSTTPDRQTACQCLKTLPNGINLGKAAGLPGKCGIRLPIKISPSIDCSRVV